MTLTTKIIRIGNSQGIRIPKALLEQLDIQGRVALKIKNGALVISPVNAPRQGWDKAFAQMEQTSEDQLLIPDTLGNEWDESAWEW